MEGVNPEAPDVKKLQLLSSLILDYELLEKAVKDGAILRILNTIKRASENSEAVHENVEVIKSCAISIGRIAEADDQYVKKIQKNDGITLLTHVIDL